jgi:hypothetical protein
MLANTMAVTDLRVSYLTNSLACFQTWSSTYQSRILSLQKSKSKINNSIALNDKVAFSNLSLVIYIYIFQDSNLAEIGIVYSLLI